MREITPTITNHLPTPPPTQKKPSNSRLPPASPDSPLLEAMELVTADGGTTGWRNLPLVLYKSCRQLHGGASKPKVSGKEVIDLEEEEEEKEPLFWDKSVSSPDEDCTMGSEGGDDGDEVVFVGSAMTAPRSLQKASNRINQSPNYPSSTSDESIAQLSRPRYPSDPNQQILTVFSSPNGKRKSSEMQDDEDIAYVGRSYKALRLEVAEEPKGSSREDTPLRAVSDFGRCCSKCGCSCNSSMGSAKGKGSGSTTLSARVRGNITALLMNQEESLYIQLKGKRGIEDWKDIAELVGAKREDLDRVRHAARWLQENLPGMVTRGKL